MPELEALIFDVDGTLADTERDGHRVAFNRAFAEAGLDWVWTPTLYGELLAVTGGRERIAYYLDRYCPACVPAGDREALAGALHGAKTRIYTELVATGSIGLRPGVARLLREARAAGLRLAIATTTTPVNVTALLESLLGPASTTWFAVIAAGDVVPAKKPAPDIYHYALRALALEPRQCLAFEDSRNGLLAALGAAVPTVITVNDYTRGEDFGGAALVLDHLGEPDRPFTAFAGATGGRTYLDLTLARAVHGGAT